MRKPTWVPYTGKDREGEIDRLLKLERRRRNMNIYAIVDRLKEPSTWGALGTAFGGVGLHGMTAEQWTQWFAIPAAVALFVSVVLKEGR